MRDSFPEVIVEYEQHVVSDGRVFTSAGISAGIDMALKVVAQYYGEDIAQATATHMEYPFSISNERRIPIKTNP
jgi:transcriptional regulator GlxA family with amidase domain